MRFPPNSSERWKRVQDLFERIEAVPPLEREVLLLALEQDAELRLEVMALLAAIEEEERANRALRRDPATS